MGLIIVGVARTNWQASAVEDPSARLPMEAAWNFCGTVAEPPSPSVEQPVLVRWLTGVSTQTVRRGLLPGWSLAPSVCSLSACAYVRLGSGGGGGGGCGETAKWKLSGCRRGVSGECEWPRGRSVQMGDVTFAC